MQRPGVGVSVIIKKDNQFLLGHRIASHGSNSWQFSGGHIEFRESLEDCCKREVLEETGVSIENIKPLTFTNDLFEDAGKHYITLFFTADIEYGQVMAKEPDKCDEWRWFEKLPENLFLPIRNLLKQRGYNKAMEKTTRNADKN